MEKKSKINNKAILESQKKKKKKRMPYANLFQLKLRKTDEAVTVIVYIFSVKTKPRFSQPLSVL